MDWQLSAEQSEIRRSIDALCSEAAAANENDAAVWRRLAESGWLGLGLPETVGGLDCGAVETAVMLERLGYHGVTAPYIPSIVWFGGVLAAATGQHAVLQRLIAGELHGAVVAADAGLTWTEDKLVTRVTGRSAPVWGADSADHMLVHHSVNPSTVWLLPTAMQGISITPVRLHGGAGAAVVTFDDVQLSPDMRLSLPQAVEGHSALTYARLAQAAYALGAMRAALEASVDYLCQRRQFGQRLADFQALQHELADAEIDTELVHSLVFGAAMTIDSAQSNAARMALQARVFADEAAKRVCKRAIQLHGAIATTDELAVGHHLSRVAVNATMLGTTAQIVDALFDNGRVGSG